MAEATGASLTGAPLSGVAVLGFLTSPGLGDWQCAGFSRRFGEHGMWAKAWQQGQAQHSSVDGSAAHAASKDWAARQNAPQPCAAYA